MEPAARTVASGPAWPMRAEGQEGVDGQPLGTHRAAVAAQASDRPLQGWGALCPRAAEGTAGCSLEGPWARPAVNILRGLGTARARPVPHAIRRPG